MPTDTQAGSTTLTSGSGAGEGAGDKGGGGGSSQGGAGGNAGGTQGGEKGAAGGGALQAGQKQQEKQQGGQKGATGDDAAGKTGADIELKLPDGVQPDETLLKSYKETLKKHGVKGEAAQAIFDLYLGTQKQAAEKSAATQKAAQEQDDKAWAERQAGWKQSARSDKEFGGEKYDANVAIAKKAVVRFSSPGLKELLDATGLGDHPEFIRLMYRVGKGLAEDTISGSQGSGGNGVPTYEEYLRANYPTMFQEKKD